MIKDIILKLFTQDKPTFIIVIIFVNIVMTFATTIYMVPAINCIFNYVLNNLINESQAHLILKLFGTGDEIHSLIAIVCITLHSWILTFIYAFSLMLISVFMAFKAINGIIKKLLALKNFSLESEAHLFDEIKIISKWIIAYSFCNLVLQVPGFPDFVYYKVVILSQGITFYFMFKDNPLNYTIKKIQMNDKR